MMPESALVVTGQCDRCSWGDRIVVHGTPWCPRFPALCHVDWNAAQFDGDEVVHTFVSARSFNRPVATGEIVLLFCNDGDWMGTWGIVEGDDPHLWVREVAWEGPSATMVYASEDGSPNQCVVVGCTDKAIRYCPVPWLDGGGFRFCGAHDGGDYPRSDWSAT